MLFRSKVKILPVKIVLGNWGSCFTEFGFHFELSIYCLLKFKEKFYKKGGGVMLYNMLPGIYPA